ncbi:DUF551 domain-containing protein [Salmonella enterica subsp. enterica serovar Cerro]|nr:DUF551 domain-containing protein [Salmonella enterica subsp. enterica serovar Cerro]
MTTITRFTKEQLRERAREKVKSLEFAVTQNAFADSRAELEEELELARIALASLTAEPVLYAAEETLAYANMGEIHLTCLSEPMGDAVIPLYTAPPAPVVPEEIPKGLAGQIVSLLAHNIGDKFLAQKIWNARRAALLQGAEAESNRDELPLDYLQGHKDGLEWAAQLAEANHPQTGDWLYDDPIELARAIRKGPDMPTVQAGNSPAIPDGWISCSERMPEDEQEVIVHNKLGYRYVSYFDEHSGLFFDMRGGNQMNCIEHILVTHWMPLPAAPEPDQS